MTLITLLTDYGTSDPYVGEMKGVLLSLAPGSTLVDITHSIAPGDLRPAAYMSWDGPGPAFPRERFIWSWWIPAWAQRAARLRSHANGHGFVGPDNGVFSAVLHGTEVRGSQPAAA